MRRKSQPLGFAKVSGEKEGSFSHDRPQDAGLWTQSAARVRSE
jgi:hypothetical protein